MTRQPDIQAADLIYQAYSMFRIFLIFLTGSSFLLATRAYASVYEFNEDGSITRHEASDYLSKIRHQNLSSEIFFPGSKNTYNDFIKRAALKFNVDPDLIHAVIFVESAYEQKAVSPKGAEGLMQLMPETARYYGVKDTFDPEQNINGGTAFLHHLLGKYDGDILLTLAAYNAGESAVEKYNGIPPYKETETYIDKVINFYQTK